MTDLTLKVYFLERNGYALVRLFWYLWLCRKNTKESFWLADFWSNFYSPFLLSQLLLSFFALFQLNSLKFSSFPFFSVAKTVQNLFRKMVLSPRMLQIRLCVYIDSEQVRRAAIFILVFVGLKGFWWRRRILWFHSCWHWEGASIDRFCSWRFLLRNY